ncbi:MFS transporter [Altererythrobacter sp. B11]|uniref:MFS transporter n=1 Tax=Altererythrobacter sp. B11 TaxID=2060312 RepID=UPI000DC6EFC4|nr:MFS transporter [Altererythrobacter sp. B11]BBC72091.1 MFS transporter [Altererythrobacter sp. B11]
MTIVPTRRGDGYQTWLTLLLSLNFGILFFDRQAANFMMPFIQEDMQLTNTQIGLLSSGLSLTWALSGLTVGPLSDKLGSRKPIVVGATVLFCLCSMLSGIAGSFLLLLGARLLMGAAEGGVMPISHAMIVSEVKPKWRGTAMGVGQNLGSNLLGSTAAPLILVPIAIAFSWREGFFFAAVPGLISAALIWFTLREPPKGLETEGQPERERVPITRALANRNVLLCALIAVLLVSFLVVTWAFMPLYLTQLAGFDEAVMGWIMAALGISAGVNAFLVPWISDQIGRKPTFIAVCLMGMILPLAALYYQGGSWFVLAVLFYFGWSLNGIFPLFMATVPAESVDPRLTATLTGIVMGIGEVLGGVFSPTLAGALADAYGLRSVMWFLMVLTMAAFALSLLLEESAPGVREKRGLYPLVA